MKHKQRLDKAVERMRKIREAAKEKAKEVREESEKQQQQTQGQ